MKGYENVQRNVLTRRTPVILRVDGRAFHTFTRGMARPYDQMLHNAMLETGTVLVREIQGAKVAYGQSDEISILITDYDTLQTDAWFAYNIQKMVSIAASVATIAFNRALDGYPTYDEPRKRTMAQFDARVFNLPREEVVNYFIWRQQDATRNSIQMMARTHFSHKECQGQSTKQLLAKYVQLREGDPIKTLEQVWTESPTHFKRGWCVKATDGIVWDREIPIFTQDREYLEKFVHPDLTTVETTVWCEHYGTILHGREPG